MWRHGMRLWGQLFGDRVDPTTLLIEPDALVRDRGVSYKQAQRGATEARIAIIG